jgi:DNA-directed RNA polymerase II subunit RPB9
MLYPKEDPQTASLMFACRTCQFSEPATAACIWRNSLKEDVQETAGNVLDVAEDPTVGNDNSDAFDSIMEDAPTSRDERASQQETEEYGDLVPDLCTMCGQEILCQICEQPYDGLALEVDDPDAGTTGEQKEERIELEKRERALSGSGPSLRTF